jgi:leucyl aminopeptidase
VEFSAAGGGLARLRTDCIVVGVYEGGKLSGAATELDAASGHAIRRIVGRGDLDGELESTLLLHGVPKIAARRVLLVGLGAERDLRETGYRTAAWSAIETLKDTGSTDATFCLHDLPLENRGVAWKVEQAVLAILDGLYRFDRLKSKPPKQETAIAKIAFRIAKRGDESAARAAIERATAIGEGVRLAKDLGNLPGNLCTPAFLADQARELGKRHRLKVRILERDDIEKLGMGAYLAVARGSRQPPKLIVMEYSPGGAQPVALVGKGITFDTGGISIKPAAAMDEMKFDMCGAASVFGALHAAALMKLPASIVGVVPAAENMPGGNAMKPGDVVTTMSGQTVEILDTDHEGRLVLCDALTYVERYKPSAVVDIATLTDGIVTALGEFASGVFSNDDPLARQLVEAGETSWDRAWHMPLWDEYQDALKSRFADFANIGSESGNAIRAACFLSRFARGFRWAHLDIAGTASRGGEEKGATGRPVPLLAHFLSASRLPG